jgi:ectoine hydroxylase-related dioxygenase (phytanoyl-CoA dioxygenase family)
MATAEAVATFPGLTDAQRAQYRKHGYLLIENAAEPIGLERIQASFERRESETKDEWEEMVASGKFTGGYGNGPNAHTIRPEWDWDTTILDLAYNPKIIPLVQDVVGPDFQVMEMLYHNHHAGAAAHTGWHRDWPTWRHPLYTLKIKVFYAVEDIDEDMGCFSLVPGTHLNDDGPPKDRYKGETLEDMPGFRKMTMKAGDAVLWDVTCWHSGLANTSDRDRKLVIYGYMPFFVKKWNADRPAQALVEWADTPMKRQLLGIHCVHGRKGWDRTDVDYLPEHVAIAAAKKL